MAVLGYTAAIFSIGYMLCFYIPFSQECDKMLLLFYLMELLGIVAVDWY